MLRPAIEFIEFRVLHIDDEPERIAGGVFAGILVAYTPFFGLHLLLGLLVSLIFKVNKFATLSFVWVSNVLTLIPIYYPSYIVGRKILNIFNPKPAMTPQEIVKCFSAIIRKIDFDSVFEADFWQSFWHLFTRIGLELFIGGVIIGIPVAALAYKLTFRSISKHRRKVMIQNRRLQKANAEN